MLRQLAQFSSFNHGLICALLVASIFTLSVQKSFCQILVFRGDTVIEVVLQSSSGYYNFKEKANVGKRDTLSIRLTADGWIISSYYHEKIRFDLKEQKFSRNGHARKIKAQLNLGAKLDSLLFELNQSYYPLDHSYFDFKANNFTVTPERVSAQAKKSEWLYIKSDYKSGNTEASIAAAAKLSDLGLFDAFLSTEFDTSGYIIISDVWDAIDIDIVSKSKSYRFQGMYPNTLKIPWLDHTTREDLLPKNLVNPKINRHLLSILPKNFLHRESLQLDHIIDQYIEWYWAKEGNAMSPYYNPN